MSEKTSVDQYGRKTWDVEAYAQEAGKKRKLDTSKAQATAKVIKNMSILEQRQKMFESSVLAVKSHTLVGTEAASTLTTYGKNKRFGFFCPICDLSFRDTLALVDHLNSPQHAKRVAHLGGAPQGEGELLPDGVRRATVEQVAQEIEELVMRLWRQKLDSGAAETLQERVRKREQFETERLRLKKEMQKKKDSEVEVEPTEMGKVMGIEGFGTTRK